MKSSHESGSQSRSTRHNHRHWHGCRVAQCSPGFNQMWLGQVWEALLNAAASLGGGNPSCSFLQLFLKELQGQRRLLQQISPVRDILPRGKRIVLLTDPKPWRKILPPDIRSLRGNSVGKVSCSSLFWGHQLSPSPWRKPSPNPNLVSEVLVKFSVKILASP